ncbi:MAG TPA: cyclin-dependent kinase inhibitor 3 family protein [Microcoleaceae cyanobacterium]|jgi:protein-tyrosine phosphatase
MNDRQAIEPQIDRRPVITSDTEPIRVDFLPNELTGLQGRLGMTIAPGKRNIGMHAIWERDLETDLTHLRHHYRVEKLVTLLETPEFAALQIPNLLIQVQAHGMRSQQFPIHDFGTPTSMQGLLELVESILEDVAQGQTVVIHCKAGLGRTGLVTAACLVALGYSPDDAFAAVRQSRPGSIETPAQEAYAEAFAKAWQARDTRDRGA